jgi:hypothetical protein
MFYVSKVLICGEIELQKPMQEEKTINLFFSLHVSGVVI